MIFSCFIIEINLGKENAPYLLHLLLAVVLLLHIETVIDESETRRPAAAKNGLEAEDCDAVFLDLERLRQLHSDGLLADGALLGVNNVDLLTLLANWCDLRTTCGRAEGCAGTCGRRERIT